MRYLYLYIFILQNLFKPFRVVSYYETNLAANKYLYEVERLRWPTVDDIPLDYEEDLNHLSDGNFLSLFSDVQKCF